MSDDPNTEVKTPKKPEKPDDRLGRKIGDKARHKARARRHAGKSVWSGLGVMGLIGWSVSVPTLIGVALGIWIDAKTDDSRSWTLALLVAGLTLGCLNAWHWISKENEAIHADLDGDDE